MCNDDHESFEKLVAGIEASTEWNNFVMAIRHQNRFFHPESFDTYLKLLCRFEYEIDTTQTFYRARLLSATTYSEMELSTSNEKNDDSGIHGLPADKMGSPPKDKASSGRANPHGITYLYLATNPETACSEIRPTLFDFISVAEFQIKQKIRVVNLKRVSLAEQSEPEKTFFRNIIRKAMKAFSMPNREQDDFEYATSQYLAAYFQHSGFDGIIYGSMNAMDDEGKYSYNLALFDPHKAYCISSRNTVYRFAQREMVFQNISVLTNKTCIAKATPVLWTTDDIKCWYSNLKAQFPMAVIRDEEKE